MAVHVHIHKRPTRDKRRTKDAPDNTKAAECRRLAQEMETKQRANPYFGSYGQAAKAYQAAAAQYAQGYIDAGDVAKREAEAFKKAGDRDIAKRGSGKFDAKAGDAEKPVEYKGYTLVPSGTDPGMWRVTRENGNKHVATARDLAKAKQIVDDLLDR